MLFWSLVVPRIQGRKWLERLLFVSAVVSLLLFPLHAYRAPEVPGSTLGHVLGFLAANAAALVAARFGRSHLRAGVLYFAVFICLVFLQAEAFSYVRQHWAPRPASSCCSDVDAR